MNRLLISILALPLTLAKAANASPSVAETISLDQALAHAITGNAQLRRANVELRRAAALLLSSRGIYDLELELAGSYSRRVTPRLADDDFSSGVWDQNAYRLELRRRLETGGSLSLGWSGSAATTNSRFECGTRLQPGQRCVLQSTGASLAVTQPLLRGLGPAVVSAEIRRREVERDIASLNRHTSAAVVVRDVVIAYAELSFAHQALTIQRAALELAREQLRNTEKQVAVGKRAPIDVAAAEQAVSGNELAMLSAEEAVFARTLALRELLGLENPVPVTILTPAEGPAAPALALSESTLIGRALSNNPEVQAARLGKRLSEVELAAARSLLWPQLDLETSIGTVGRSQDAGEAFRQAGAFQNTAWFAGLTFSLPVQNRTARGRLEAARQQREVVEVGVEAHSRDIRNRVLRLVNALRSGTRRIELGRKTVSFAELNLKAERARFGLGHATNNDVLRVQQDLREAQLAVASAALELTVNEAALATLTGDILERHRLALKGVD